MEAERWKPPAPESKPRQSYVAQCLEKHAGPIIAATDYMRLFADQIRPYIDRRFTVLGTDGFGRSDTANSCAASSRSTATTSS